MKKHLFRSGFNLIEVTMAIAIVGIGIAGVMALFPPAIEANKAANNQNYIGLVSDSFLGYLEGNYLRNFNRVANTVSSSKVEPAVTFWTGPKTSLSSSGFPGLYTTSNSNVFAIESADGSVNALITMWQSGSTPVDGFTGSDTDKVRRVYIEASWPAAVPYDRREKKLYIYDVFKE